MSVKTYLSLKFVARNSMEITCWLYSFCTYRILTQNNLKAVGRNYFKPDDRVNIPQHG